MGATSDKSCHNNELSQEKKLEIVHQVRELQENGYDVRMDLSGGELFTNIPAHTELLTALSEIVNNSWQIFYKGFSFYATLFSSS